jgi:hypothetical protein
LLGHIRDQRLSHVRDEQLLKAHNPEVYEWVIAVCTKQWPKPAAQQGAMITQA